MFDVKFTCLPDSDPDQYIKGLSKLLETHSKAIRELGDAQVVERDVASAQNGGSIEECYKVLVEPLKSFKEANETGITSNARLHKAVNTANLFVALSALVMRMGTLERMRHGKNIGLALQNMSLHLQRDLLELKSNASPVVNDFLKIYHNFLSAVSKSKQGGLEGLIKKITGIDIQEQRRNAGVTALALFPRDSDNDSLVYAAPAR